MTTCPIALFGFNRPRLLERVLARVLAARPSVLVLIADGPRAGHAEDRELCDEVRRLFDAVEIDGIVERDYSVTNLGSGRRIASGLDRIFDRHDRAIILEDDLLPEPSFFPFCEELLERFRDDERIAMVSGCNLLAGRTWGAHSYFFSSCVGTWGWGTWRRSWREYDFEMSAWPAYRAAGTLSKVWPSERAAAYWSDRLDEAYRSHEDYWDYQWAFAMWSHDRLQVYPNTNLISNIGCGPAATHWTNHDPRVCDLPTAPMRFPLRHPAAVERCLEADLAEFETIFALP